MTLDELGDRLPVLRTARCLLRHPVPSDAEQVLAVFGDPEAMQYWSREPMTALHEAHELLATIDAGFRDRQTLQWAITVEDPSVLVGTVTLFRLDTVHRRVELGYMLARSHWGRGLASEAVHEALRFAFDALGAHRIEADLDPRNGASARLLERLGFRREGFLRDRWFTYGEFSDSWIYGLLEGELTLPQPRG